MSVCVAMNNRSHPVLQWWTHCQSRGLCWKTYWGLVLDWLLRTTWFWSTSEAPLEGDGSHGTSWELKYRNWWFPISLYVCWWIYKCNIWQMCMFFTVIFCPFFFSSFPVWQRSLSCSLHVRCLLNYLCESRQSIFCILSRWTYMKVSDVFSTYFQIMFFGFRFFKTRILWEVSRN